MTAQSDAQPVLLDRVEVVGTTSLPETGTPVSQVPTNVVIVHGDALTPRRALNLSDALDHDVGGVSINDTTGNPFQPDVSFRGFTASPVLGTPQGISVFFDGVRVNEVFGDTVNWDLIPTSAIASVTLMPGSNPVFGLNSLGGALSIRTKDGFSNPGTSLTTYGGSFGRRAVEMETGGSSGAFGYFLTANDLRESGWGEHNPSRLQQLFGKSGYHDGTNNIDVSVSLADNRLEGNQTLPLSFLSAFRQAYTYPDYQVDRLTFVNATFSHAISPLLAVSGNLYFRKFDNDVFNSNINDDFDPGATVGKGNEPTGNAINRIAQYRPGGTLQLTSLRDIAAHPNHLVLGLAYDRAHVNFLQLEQESAALRNTSSDAPAILHTSLRSTNSTKSFFATDTLSTSARSALTLSARYDDAAIHLRDQLGTALNGDHRFHRLDPAAGLTYSPSPLVTAFLSYSQAFRVPSPVELTCADPNAPCSLPNAFASDPSLKPVVSRSFEVGARGKADSLRWNVSAFHTVVHDDIEFISSGGGSTSAGYFRNVGQTLRQGVDVAVDATVRTFTASADYSYIAATFRTPLTLNSPDSSAAAPISCATCTDINVAPGDRLPGIPHHLLKVRLSYAPNDSLSLGANVIARSSSFARGDESNQDRNGPVPGYALLGLDGRIRIASHLEFFIKGTNVLNRRYSTFATLGQNVFTGLGGTFDATGSTWRNEQFRSAGIPRGIWVGLTYEFGARPTPRPPG